MQSLIQGLTDFPESPSQKFGQDDLHNSTNKLTTHAAQSGNQHWITWACVSPQGHIIKS